MEINSTAMRASFKTLTGKTITLEYEDWHTVLNIKEKIQEREGLPPEEQRLMYEEYTLDDDEVFLDAIKLIQTAKGELIDQSPGSIVTVHLILRLRGGGNVIAPKQDQIRFNSPSGSDDDGDSSNSQSDHELQQNDFSHEIATADYLPTNGQEQFISSECTGNHACSSKLSSKGSRRPRRFITNKLRKWNPWN